MPQDASTLSALRVVVVTREVTQHVMRCITAGCDRTLSFATSGRDFYCRDCQQKYRWRFPNEG
jgi:hypothetical protein